ncbi:hypothetical protein EUU22_00330 [Ciceribacter ferrooxidans]|uniref:Uncharacterized protein n=2 Tax=Ciceribacter ferrooxidans TaxID=2509717 RepID=A0A4Q2U1N8_9HYPH|nr:hypothetical protein EUU22_00330 [Ciceribacter ferrooxidans]
MIDEPANWSDSYLGGPTEQPLQRHFSHTHRIRLYRMLMPRMP